MPKPRRFYYQCWKCPLPAGRDEPTPIDGGATQGQADAAWERHYAQYHAEGAGLKLTGDWIGQKARQANRVPQQRRRY